MRVCDGWRGAATVGLTWLLVVGMVGQGGADPAATSSMPWRVGRPDAIAVSGSTLYFSNRGDIVPRGATLTNFGVFSAAEALADASPAANGTVWTVLADGVGGWYLGGDFTTIGGLPRAGLAHVRADGSVDPTFVANTVGAVYTIERSGADLVIGGAFTTVNLVPRVGVAVVSAVTGIVQAAAPAINGSASAVLVAGATTYVGGTFTTAGGQPRSGLAAFNTATGALVPGFVANLDPGRSVTSLARSGSSLFVAGNMLAVNGAARTGLAKIDLTSGLVDAAFNSGLDGAVNTIAIDGATVFAGGGFTTAGGQPRLRLAALATSTGMATPWRADVDAGIAQLRVDAGVLYAGGLFDTVAAVNRQGAAAISIAAPATVLPWQPAMARGVAAIGIGGGRVAIGGSVLGWSAAKRRSLGAIDLVSGDLLPWAPTITGAGVSEILVAANRIVVAGPFTDVDGQPRNSIAFFDATTHALLPLTVQHNGGVAAIAAIGNVLYFSGTFTQVNNTFRLRLAAIDMTTGQLLPWDPQADVYPYSIVPQGDRLILGGEFTSLIGTNGFRLRNGVGAITTAGVVTDFDPAPGYPTVYGFVGAVATAGNRVFLSGNFTSVQGAPRQGLAAVDATTGAVLPWAPTVDGYATLSVHGGWVYLAGIFTTVSGQPRAGLARVETTSAALSPWLPGPGLISGQLVAATELGVAFVGFRGANDDRLAFYPELALGGVPGPTPQLSARTVGSTLTIGWQPPVIGPRPTGYVLEAGTASGLANVAAVPLTTNGFSIGGVPPQQLFVRVRAANGAGLGTASREVAFTAGLGACTASPGPPPQPTTVVAGGTVVVSWTTAAGPTPTGYTLLAGTAPGLSNIGAFPLGPATSFTTGGVPAGAYFVRVVATNACGPSAPSPDGELRVGGAPGPPGRPFALTAATSPGTLALSWTRGTGAAASAHWLEAGTGPGLSNIAVVPLGAATSFSVAGVPRGVYYLRVRAANSAGVSAVSGEAVATVP